METVTFNDVGFNAHQIDEFSMNEYLAQPG